MRYDVNDDEIVRVKNYNILTNQQKENEVEEDGNISSHNLKEEFNINENKGSSSCMNFNELA
jgi:hypothetical protein